MRHITLHQSANEPLPYSAHSKGFSLVEILIVLGVIAIITIGAFMIYPRVVNARDGENQAANIRTLHASISTALNGKSLFGVSSAALIAADIASDEEFNSPWSPIGFHPTKNGYACTASAGCNGYSLRYDNVPAGACIALVQAIAPTSTKTRVQGTTNHILKGSPVAGAPAGTPNIIFNPGVAPSACNDGATVSIYIDMVMI